MARKSKAQLEAEARAKEVAETVSAEIRNLIEQNYASIVAVSPDHGYSGVPVSFRLTINTDSGNVGTIGMNVPRKAFKATAYPESPSDKIQSKMDFNEDDDNA